MEVQKEIHKEYLAWTGTSMIGNVGGQLGLWVGFSVTGFMAGTFNVIPKMCKYVIQMLKQQRIRVLKFEKQCTLDIATSLRHGG